MQEINDEQKKVWALACLAAPIAHVASGLPWEDVCWVSLLSAGIRRWISSQKLQQKLPLLCSIIGLLAAAQALVLMENCWPKQKDTDWIMMILLILGAIQAEKGEKSTIQGGLLLWWFTAFLLGSVLISAIPGVNITELGLWKGSKPWKKIRELLILLLLPGLLEYENRQQKIDIKLLILPVVFSVCVQGVLTAAAAEESKAPFYELSRTIQLYGILERMEAMAWLGLMLGTYLYLSCLMIITAGRTEGLTRQITLLTAAAIVKGMAVFVKKEMIEYIILAFIIVICFVSAWMQIGEKIKERKMQKNENNS